MANHRHTDENGTCDGTVAFEDAFRVMAQGLTHLQEALRLQQQAMEHRMQEALRLQKQDTNRKLQKQGQRAASEMREMERKLREKDDAIRALQQQLRETQERVTAVEKIKMPSEGSGGEGGLQRLEGRVEKVEATLQSAMQKFLPRVDAVLHQLEKSETTRASVVTAASSSSTASARKAPTMGGAAVGGGGKPPPPEASRSISKSSPTTTSSTVSAREAPTMGGAAVGGGGKPPPPEASRSVSKSSPTTTSSAASARAALASGGAAAGVVEDLRPPKAFLTPSSSSSPTSSDAGHQSGEADEEERERRRVELRVREVKLRMEEARKYSPPLQEQLFKAVREGKLTDVRRLIDCGANVNYTEPDGVSPLHRAIIWMHADVLRVLLQRGADVNAVNCFGCTALHWAAMNDLRGQCLDLLVNAGGDVNARDKDGETPLHCAAYRNNEKTMWALLVAGARRDFKPWGGRWRNKTPFEVATSPDIRDLLQ